MLFSFVVFNFVLKEGTSKYSFRLKKQIYLVLCGLVGLGVFANLCINLASDVEESVDKVFGLITIYISYEFINDCLFVVQDAVSSSVLFQYGISGNVNYLYGFSSGIAQ